MANEEPLSDDEELECARALAEIDEANSSFAAAAGALNTVITQLGNTRKLLGRYVNYFKVTVVIGVLAVVIAVSAAVAQYHFNQRLEENQETIEREAEVREYQDCKQSNEGREDVIDVLITLATFGGDSTTPEEEAIIQAVRDKLPFADCESLNPDTN